MSKEIYLFLNGNNIIVLVHDLYQVRQDVFFKYTIKNALKIKR